MGARRIRNKGPGGAQDRIRNRPRVARGLLLFFVLENHMFSFMRAEQALMRKESQGMNVSSGFHLQEARQAMLDESLLKRGVLLRLGLGWFGGVITRRAQEASRRAYDYRLMLKEDQSTLSVKLPLEAYSTDANATVGAWALLEPGVGVPLGGSRASQSGRASVANVRNIPLDPFSTDISQHRGAPGEV